MTRAQIRARESRWARPVAAATFLALVLLVASRVIGSVSGSGEAEVLRAVHDKSGSVVAAALLQGLGLALFALPVAYLFRAVETRGERVRAWLIWPIVAAIALLAVASGLTGAAATEAGDDFVGGQARPTLTKREAGEECAKERKDEGADFLSEEFEPRKGETPIAACERRKIEDDAASNALSEASLAPAATILQAVGGLGFAVALFYTCLWGMRTGLLPRFWGALGMASGVGLLLGPLALITLIWFIYFGLLVQGLVPGGRPPAWEAGEPVPWPSPGERAAAELEPEDVPGAADAAQSSPGEARRKRKQRG